MIVYNITEIRKEDYFCTRSYKTKERLVFYGDLDMGLYPSKSNSTTKECLQDYIKNLEEQLELAKEALSEM